eukprot:jgi/Botrbrau1/6451/Bobra.0034s0026.1
MMRSSLRLFVQLFNRYTELARHAEQLKLRILRLYIIYINWLGARTMQYSTRLYQTPNSLPAQARERSLQPRWLGLEQELHVIFPSFLLKFMNLYMPSKSLVEFMSKCS